MKTLSIGMFAVLAWVLASAAYAASTTEAYIGSGGFKKNVHYKQLDNPRVMQVTDKIEVLELFWYGCPHCYQLEGEMRDWKANLPADVNFVQMPAIPTPRWEQYAKVFYAAEVLGVHEKIHVALFEAIHKHKRRIKSNDDLAALFAEQGVSKKDFMGAMNSFAVDAKIRKARELTRRYKITGVPAMVVNGKYTTSGSMAGSHEKMLEVIDHLVDLERPAPQETTAAKP